MSTDITYDEFLDSETICLTTPDSTRSFRIHGKLLERKCKAIYTPFEKGFSEASQNQYTCQDTTEGTLGRFVEWAYTGDYPVEVKPTGDTGAEPKVFRGTGNGEPPAPEKTLTSDVQPDKHPLLTHVRLYIFGSIYLIEGLKKHAFGKLEACLQKMDEKNEFGMQLIVIAMLRKAFSEIPSDDDLLDWLARYASFRVDRLRTQPSFNDLLLSLPELGARMVGLLPPRSEPFWPSKSPPANSSPFLQAPNPLANFGRPNSFANGQNLFGNAPPPGFNAHRDYRRGLF